MGSTGAMKSGVSSVNRSTPREGQELRVRVMGSKETDRVHCGVVHSPLENMPSQSALFNIFLKTHQVVTPRFVEQRSRSPWCRRTRAPAILVKQTIMCNQRSLAQSARAVSTRLACGSRFTKGGRCGICVGGAYVLGWDEIRGGR